MHLSGKPIILMGMKRVGMTASAFAQLVRTLAADSGNVILLPHARKRMIERHITLPQIIDVLTGGRVSEPPALDIYGNWKATLERTVNGRRIGAAVAVTDKAIVITVFD